MLLRGSYRVFCVIELTRSSLAKSRYVDTGMKSLDLWKSYLRGINVLSLKTQLILLSVDSAIGLLILMMLEGVAIAYLRWWFVVWKDLALVMFVLVKTSMWLIQA